MKLDLWSGNTATVNVSERVRAISLRAANRTADEADTPAPIREALELIPGRYQNATLRSCEAPKDVLYWEPAQAWCLGILGPLAAGKTHLATAIWASQVRKLGGGLWWDTQDLIARARWAIKEEKESELVAELVDTEILLLDDLGRQRETEYSHETLTLAIRGRCNRKIPTIWTSNLSAEGLLDWDDAVASRLTAATDTLLHLMPDNKWRNPK